MADKTPMLDSEATDQAPPGPGGLEVTILLLLGLLWLAATLRLSDSLIIVNRDDSGQLASAISLVLPTVVYASLLAGAAVGLATTALRVAGPAAAGVRRAIAGSVGGAVLGLITVGLILLRYGDGSSIAVLAATLGAAATIGGVAAVLPRPVLAAAVTGTLEVFVIGIIAGLFQSPLKSLFGGTSDPTSQVRAASWLSVATAIVQGIIVGLTAYFYLRRRVDAPRWPSFALAGALPGGILLVGLGLSFLASSGLSGLGGQLSDADRMVRNIVSGSGLNQALTVAFLGAIVAMVAVGRTLQRPPEADDET